MANEEIEISELEFTEELASDNLIPVESSTDTKATSLQAIKNWLSSFFVGKKGNETIDGIKTFVLTPTMKSGTVNITSSIDSSQTHSQTVNFGQINIYDVNSKLLGGFFIYKNPTAGVFGGVRVFDSNGNERSIRVYTDGTTYCTPSSAINSMVTTTGILRSPNGYMKLGNGVILQWGSVTPTEGNGTVTFPIPFAGFSKVVTGISGALSEPRVVRVYNNSTTSFDYICYKQAGDKASSLATAFSWFAIGY